MNDIKENIISIGDIVKIENSPIKSDNATYVVAQDGTSKSYSGKNLTLYKVAKHKEGYSLSRSSYNICFYPLSNFSSKYKYTREEMNAATIEILLKADSSAFNLIKNDDKYEAEETEQTYFRAVMKFEDKEIEDISYSASEQDKMTAFFSNITLKHGETIEICKQDYSWGYYNRNIDYKLESTKPVEEITEVNNDIVEQAEQIIIEINGLHYDITEDTDTRDNSKIYVVKVKEKLSKDEYLNVNNYMKSIGGYYSKFKHGFLFKENPTELLSTPLSQAKNNNDIKTSEQAEQQKEEVKQQKEEVKQQTIEYDITEQQEKNSIVWFVRIKNNIPNNEFANIKRNMAIINGFYSSLKDAFIFKYNPTEKLNT